MSSLNYMELCRLCLVKERVSIPIFEGEGDVRQIFLKIASCLPVKVARDDKLPKKICDDCMFKLDNAYQFWNTSANAEKQLLQWLGEIANEDPKTCPPSNTIETEQLVLKEEAIEQDQSSELNKNLNRVETVLHEDDRGGSEEEEESESEEEGTNSEDSGDDGGEPPGKEEAESDEEPYEPLEPTTFVNVSLAGSDEAGPSGLQQQAQSQPQSQAQTSSQATQQTTQQPSQFLAPGAPSTSTAAPAATASGSATPLRMRDGLVATKKKPHKRKVIQPRKRLHLKLGNSKMCKICYVEYPESELESHSLMHFDILNPIVKIEADSDSEEYKCPDCKLTFESGELLASHMTSHNDAFMHSCDKCDDKFRTVRNLRQHKREAHEKDKKFGCNICGRAMSSEHNLNQHIKRHSYPFSCESCSRTFLYSEDLDKHKKTHGPRMLKCNICGDEYVVKRDLQIHRRRVHMPLKQKPMTHKCLICGKLFPYRSALLLHQPSHSGDKMFKCDECGATFRYKQSMYAHKKCVHPESLQDILDKLEDKYANQCEICGKTFPYKNSLRVHVNSHTRANTYACDVCGKSFSTRDHLKYHCKIHTGDKSYTCDVCGKAFIKSWDLKQHLRTHTGERPYKCDMCEKAFTQRSTLTIHKRLHTGQRPYQCEICKHDFVCKALLTVHQKTHEKHKTTECLAE